MATIKKMEQKQETEKLQPKFVPGKVYEWDPTTEFGFNGQEYTVLYNSLAIQVNAPDFQEKLKEARKVIGLFEAYMVLQAAFEKGVVEGVIKEQVQTTVESLDEPLTTD